MAGPRRAKAYLALRALGRGAHARVTLALHARTGTKVLVRGVRKAELPDLRLLAREMGCMKALHHPNIVELFEVVDTGRELQLVMEYVQGRDLQDHLAERGRLDEGEARRLFGQMLAALSHCHAKGVAHLDVRPENILLTREGKVKLADFGLSVQGFKRRLSACCCGPHHRAPEVYLGQQYSGPKVDVWSLGVVLYQMVTGTLPFGGACPGEVRDRVLGGHVRLPSYLSAQCRDLLAAMLARDPQSRSTLESIQQHPWVEGGQLPSSEPPLCPQDPAITKAMERLGYPRREIREAIEEKKYDDVMGTYLILRSRKLEGEEDPEEEEEERPRRVTFHVPCTDTAPPDGGPDSKACPPQPEAPGNTRRPSILRKQALQQRETDAAPGSKDISARVPEQEDTQEHATPSGPRPLLEGAPEKSRPPELGPVLKDAWEDGNTSVAGPQLEPGEHSSTSASVLQLQDAGEQRSPAALGPQLEDAKEHSTTAPTGPQLERGQEPAPQSSSTRLRPPPGCGWRGANAVGPAVAISSVDYGGLASFPGVPSQGARATRRTVDRIVAFCCCCAFELQSNSD